MKADTDAQVHEGPSAISRMAPRLSSAHRCCVTGTPFWGARPLDDLQGLLEVCAVLPALSRFDAGHVGSKRKTALCVLLLCCVLGWAKKPDFLPTQTSGFLCRLSCAVYCWARRLSGSPVLLLCAILRDFSVWHRCCGTIPSPTRCYGVPQLRIRTMQVRLLLFR